MAHGGAPPGENAKTPDREMRAGVDMASGDHAHTGRSLSALNRAKGGTTMNRRTRALLAAGTVAVLAAAIGIGYALHGDSKTSPSTASAAATTTSSAATFTLAGQFSLGLGAFQWDHAADGTTPCVSDQGYSDITAGAPVVITDQGGTTIATGQLITGSATVDSATGRATACVFSFVIPQVPDRPFYGVTVSHRGTQTYSTADARAGNIRLTLG